MKPLKFSETSWHYRLARFGDSYQKRNLSDICGYTRAVLTGSVWFLMVAFLVVVATKLVADTLAWVAALVMHGWVEPSILATIILTVLVILAFCCVCGGIAHLYDKRGQRLRDSFVASGYRSIKHRYCVPVEIVRKDQQ